jgi:hypothetical protein
MNMSATLSIAPLRGDGAPKGAPYRAGRIATVFEQITGGTAPQSDVPILPGYGSNFCEKGWAKCE